MSTKRYIWLLLFLVLAPPLQGQQQASTSRKASKHFQQARRCLESGDLNCTEEALRKAIKADKQFVAAYQMLAQIYFDQGRLEDAIEAYSASLDIDPEGNPEGYRLLAGLVLYSGDYERSLELIEHYLDLPSSLIRNPSEAESLRQKCLFAIEAMRHPVPFKPENLGEAVNSAYSEYWPSLSVDEKILMFTVMLPGPGSPGSEDTYLQEDFYYSVRSDGSWTKEPIP